MDYPKTECFKIVVKSFEQAVSMATKKRKFGGCYESINDVFVVYWLAKDDSRIKNFAW